MYNYQNTPIYPILNPRHHQLTQTVTIVTICKSLTQETSRKKAKESIARDLGSRNGRWIRFTRATKSKFLPLLFSIVFVCNSRNPCNYVLRISFMPSCSTPIQLSFWYRQHLETRPIARCFHPQNIRPSCGILNNLIQCCLGLDLGLFWCSLVRYRT